MDRTTPQDVEVGRGPCHSICQEVQPGELERVYRTSLHCPEKYTNSKPVQPACMALPAGSRAIRYSEPAGRDSGTQAAVPVQGQARPVPCINPANTVHIHDILRSQDTNPSNTVQELRPVLLPVQPPGIPGKVRPENLVPPDLLLRHRGDAPYQVHQPRRPYGMASPPPLQGAVRQGPRVRQHGPSRGNKGSMRLVRPQGFLRTGIRASQAVQAVRLLRQLSFYRAVGHANR